MLKITERKTPEDYKKMKLSVPDLLSYEVFGSLVSGSVLILCKQFKKSKGQIVHELEPVYPIVPTRYVLLGRP